MKKLISLTASLPIVCSTVLGFSSAAEASVLNIGDSLSGQGGLLVLGLNNSFADPTQVYYGTQNPTPTGIVLGKTGDTATFADLGSSADTLVNIAGASPTGNGFTPFNGATAKIRSYITANPDNPLLTNFLTIDLPGLGPDLFVDLDRNFFQAGFFPTPNVGPFFVGQARAKVRHTGDAPGVFYHAIFRISTQNIAPATFGPNVGNTAGLGSVGLVSNTETYSWQIEVTTVKVPESSNVAGLLTLGVLAGGVVLKRKVSKEQ